VLLAEARSAVALNIVLAVLIALALVTTGLVVFVRSKERRARRTLPEQPAWEDDDDLRRWG
jgi:hypothetical protein